MEEERVNYAREALTKVDVEDVARYAHDKFNFDMFDVQKEFLRNMCSGKSVWTSRGFGRTRIVYILANYLTDKYNDIFLPIYVIKKLEYNDKPETADVRYPYTVCINAGLAPIQFFEEMEYRIPEEQFNREYRGIQGEHMKIEIEERNKAKKLEEQLEELIMDMYDLRPSTAYELAQVVKRMATMAQNEYLFGTQDRSER